MRILDVRGRTLPSGSAALAITTDANLTGYAFSIRGSGEGAPSRERFVSRLLGAKPQGLLDESGLLNPASCVRLAMPDEKPAGGEPPGAIGLIEAAAWDLRAKMQGVPLWRSIADYFQVAGAVAQIEVYASCAPLRTDDVLTFEVGKAIDAGYRCVKIKVGGEIDDDLRRLERAAAALDPAARWAADLNGGLAPAMAEKWFDAIEPFKLAWIEEPAPALDFELLKRYAGLSPTAVATGENLFSLDDARNLLRSGGLRPERDLLQFDPLLSYGLVEYSQIIQLFESAGWRRESFLPHAGHLFAAHCVAGLRLGMAEAVPDTSLPHGGYWDGVRVAGGKLAIPELPGVGYEAKSNLHRLLQAL
jgi:L-alanine-DL-glutamate epimerase-like enolase superfamily enzyme